MKAPTRFYSLDALRGFAALSVVIFHWRMWNVDDRWRERSFDVDALPLHRLLSFFYESGYAAVGLFFCLSGFVFYWLYRDAIWEGKVSAEAFTCGRFSRLYPLHLGALVLVAIGQWCYGRITGGGQFEFADHSLSSFMKHALLLPLAVGPRNFSFNAPDWTLSVEAWLYVIFFVVARLAPLRFAATVGIVAASYYLTPCAGDFCYGVTAFFMGGLAYLIFERVESRLIESVLRIVLGVSWPMAFVLGSGIVDIQTTRIYWLESSYAIYVMFPCTVLYLAIAEARRGTLAKPLAWVGDLTYSTYLLHFPLYVLFALALRATGHDFGPMLTAWGMLVYFGILIPVAMLSYRMFERPAQAVIRHRAAAIQGSGARGCGVGGVA